MTIALLLTALAGGRVAEPTTAELEARMAALINVERDARGLEALELVEDLSALARTYSRRMAATGKVHHALDRPVEERVRDVLPDTCRFGENVSKHTSVEYSLGDLLMSPGHRANLLSPEFTLLGLGIARGDDGFLYITQELAAFCAPRRD